MLIFWKLVLDEDAPLFYNAKPHYNHNSSYVLSAADHAVNYSLVGWCSSAKLLSHLYIADLVD